MIKKLTFKKLAVLVAILLLFSGLTVLGLYLLDKHNEKAMLEYVNHVETSRYRHPAVDIENERVVIPEARISLPMNSTSRDMRYQYLAGNKELWLSTAIAMGQQAPEDDPGCDKIVRILQTDRRLPSANYVLADTVTANDGTILYVYRHKPCSFYDDTLSTDLTELAKFIQYY